MKPAWSWQFEPQALAAVAPLVLPSPITKEWAWADATGAGVNVAIIDSGVDGEHPAVGGLAGGVAIEHDADESDRLRLDEGDHRDLHGHGTACAGIIRRAAPAAQLYSVRVLGSSLQGKGPAFLRGLRWALDAGMHVVNLSLGTTKREYYAALHELVDEAAFKSVMLVSAMSNSPGPSYPSQYSSVFSVAAHQRLDPFGLDYNPAPPVEFGAPGIDVPVAWRGGRTVTVTGNSFAAAHVTGLVARTLSKHPGLTPFQLKTILCAVADNTRR